MWSPIKSLIKRVPIVGAHLSRREQSRGATLNYNTWASGLGMVSLLISSQLHENSSCATSDSLITNKNKIKQLRENLRDLLESSDEAQWLDDGDFTLNRFLVSRNCDVSEAESMFRSTVAWRSRYHIREEYDTWKENNSEEKHLAKIYGYASRSGYTEDGSPLNIERVGQYDVGGCVRIPGMTDVVSKAYIMYMEESFRAVREVSLEKDRYIRCKVVTDAKGVGLAHIKHSQLMRDVIAIGQKNYPEIVQSVLVVRAPVAMYTLWNFGVKWVLNERVKKKVFICRKNYDSKLQQLSIDRKDLPKFLDGTLCDSHICQAKPLPKTILFVPPVSAYGRETPLVQPRLSVREGMSNMAAWATAAAD